MREKINFFGQNFGDEMRGMHAVNSTDIRSLRHAMPTCGWLHACVRALPFRLRNLQMLKSLKPTHAQIGRTDGRMRLEEEGRTICAVARFPCDHVSTTFVLNIKHARLLQMTLKYFGA